MCLSCDSLLHHFVLAALPYVQIFFLNKLQFMCALLGSKDDLISDTLDTFFAQFVSVFCGDAVWSALSRLAMQLVRAVDGTIEKKGGKSVSPSEESLRSSLLHLVSQQQGFLPASLPPSVVTLVSGLTSTEPQVALAVPPAANSESKQFRITPPLRVLRTTSEADSGLVSLPRSAGAASGDSSSQPNPCWPTFLSLYGHAQRTLRLLLPAHATSHLVDTVCQFVQRQLGAQLTALSRRQMEAENQNSRAQWLLDTSSCDSTTDIGHQSFNRQAILDELASAVSELDRCATAFKKYHNAEYLLVEDDVLAALAPSDVPRGMVASRRAYISARLDEAWRVVRLIEDSLDLEKSRQPRSIAEAVSRAHSIQSELGHFDVKRELIEQRMRELLPYTQQASAIRSELISRASPSSPLAPAAALDQLRVDHRSRASPVCGSLQELNHSLRLLQPMLGSVAKSSGLPKPLSDAVSALKSAMHQYRNHLVALGGESVSEVLAAAHSVSDEFVTLINQLAAVESDVFSKFTRLRDAVRDPAIAKSLASGDLENCASESEAPNASAASVLKRMKLKLQGRDPVLSGDLCKSSPPVETLVDLLIAQATNRQHLARLYDGWGAWL